MGRMRRFAALLRGVSPMNLKMPDLQRCVEGCGYVEVKTVLATGNVVFGAKSGSPGAIEKALETAMEKELGRTFLTLVRPVDALRELLASDPYEGAALPPNAKRVVTFLKKKPRAVPELPVELEGARIVRLEGGEAFSWYVPSPRGPAFMVLIEKTFGKDVTTRTWESVARIARDDAKPAPPKKRAR